MNMDEYIARTRVVFSPEDKPIMLHRVAYATTTAGDLRCLNRQIYTEILAIPPPTLCPRIEYREIHKDIGLSSSRIKKSLRRVKVLGRRDPDAADCLLGYFRDVEVAERSQTAKDGFYTNDFWITFTVNGPYPDTNSRTRYWNDATGRRCCTHRGRRFRSTDEDFE